MLLTQGTPRVRHQQKAHRDVSSQAQLQTSKQPSHLVDSWRERLPKYQYQNKYTVTCSKGERHKDTKVMHEACMIQKALVCPIHWLIEDVNSIIG